MGSYTFDDSDFGVALRDHILHVGQNHTDWDFDYVCARALKEVLTDGSYDDLRVEIYEDPESEPTEPEEDDLITHDHINVYESGKRVLVTSPETFNRDVMAYMERVKYYPNVWWISDHGNPVLLDVTQED